MLNIEESPLPPGIVILRFTGRIAIGRDSQQIEWKTADLIRDNKTRVIFDLAGVDFLDSTGIGIIVMCAGKLKDAGGHLRLAAASGVVNNTLRLTSIHNLVPMHSTVEEAATALRQARSAAGG